MAQAGGIDIGGTKIEASVFDENWQLINTRRVPTPTDDYDELVAANVTITASDATPVADGAAGINDATDTIAVTWFALGFGFGLGFRLASLRILATHVAAL